MNPAVTIALAVVKKFKWNKVPKYITAQMLGGFFGALLVFITYVGKLKGNLVMILCIITYTIKNHLIANLIHFCFDHIGREMKRISHNLKY